MWNKTKQNKSILADIANKQEWIKKIIGHSSIWDRWNSVIVSNVLKSKNFCIEPKKLVIRMKIFYYIEQNKNTHTEPAIIIIGAGLVQLGKKYSPR